jgi:hypothetical protein
VLKMSNNTKEASAKQWANLFFNPLAFGKGDLPTTMGDTPTSTALKHAAGLGIGYGSVGMLLRYLKKLKDEADVTTTDEKMKAYIEAKNPILSLDPSTRDVKREAKEKSIGVQETDVLKEAGWTDPAKSPLHPALAIAAALAAGTGGWALADRKIDRKQQEDIDSEVAKEENKIDQLLYNEYLRTRGLEKSAKMTLGTELISETSAPLTTGTSSSHNPLITKGGALATSVYGVVALGLMALAHKASRSYMDANDPNRQRMGQLRAALDEKGKVRGGTQFADLSDFSKASAPKPLKSSGVSLQRKSDSKNPAKDSKAVDPSDPYAELLAQG